MFDIFVVVCKDDFPQLKILARSIDKFCHNFPINKIVVVGNDHHENINDALTNQCHYFGSFANKVSIHNYNEIYDGPWHDGYDVQQILKLNAFKLCNSKYIMILDAKNFFVKPVELNAIIQRNKLRAVYDTTAEFWLENKIFTHSLFDLSSDSRQIMVRTPFFIKRETLKECLDYIAEHFNYLPQDIIGHNKEDKTNEFMLLQSFILKKYGNFESYFFFTNDNPQCGSYNSGIWPIDIERWNDFHWDLIDGAKVPRNLEQVLTLEWAVGENIFCSSVHRRSIRLMTDDVIEQLKLFWIKLDLCNYSEATDVINGIKNYV